MEAGNESLNAAAAAAVLMWEACRFRRCCEKKKEPLQ
jgi:tRNA G18 (ribose-2'-O)-methylase SpoU